MTSRQRLASNPRLALARPRQSLAASLLVLLVSALSACSEDPTTEPGDTDKKDTILVLPDGWLDDVIDVSTGPDGCTQWWCDLATGDAEDATAGTDIAPYTDEDGTVIFPDVDAAVAPDGDASAGSDTGAGLCDFPANPKPGEAGAPCKSAVDCFSGFCIPTEDGDICTVTTVGNCCPGGFQSTGITVQGELYFVCAPKTAFLCRPCINNTDCVTNEMPDALCINYGDDGRYCGATCAKDSDCPTDYECKDAQGISNNAPSGQSKQCIRKVASAGICPCSVKAIAQGANTVCSVTNGFGQCGGTRTCAPGGLSACNAKTPVGEACNLQDDDCDGMTDELGTDKEGVVSGPSGCSPFFVDVDNDGFGNATGEAGTNACLCQATNLYTAASATDCNDGDSEIRPNAFEYCDDIDNDCDGQTDEMCDFDGDGYCDQKALIKGEPKVCVNGINDCNDKNKNVAPGMQEICGDGLDNDCNGQTDFEENAKGCKPYYYDGDGDQWGTGDAKCLCTSTGAYTAEKNGDCNDLDVQVNPNQIEVCGNFKDDNCNNKQDEDGALDCENFYVDKDTDSWGTGTPKCMCGPSLTHTASKTGDCADLDPTTNPTSPEQCGDAVDNDCDSKTDEADAIGCTKLYADADNDTYGDDNNFKCLCGLDANFPMFKAIKGGDCNDGSPAANPKGSETCDAVDNDCDGATDEEGAANCTVWYADTDADAYGDKMNAKCLCAPSPPYMSALSNDCNDKNQQVYPAAPEICDNVDNNCNSQIDEENAQGCTYFFLDDDGDGYGTTTNGKCLCKATKPYSAVQPGDCNDANTQVRPGLPEYCGDGFDNDCDGTVDETDSTGCITFYEDKDGDGFGNSQVSDCTCAPKGQLTALIGGDCNDNDVNVRPTLTEQCDDLDNDCNGITDDANAVGCTNYFIDVDLDNYGITAQSSCLCKAKAPYTAAQGGDCNDADPKVSPVQIETCNYKDDNCNGVIDSDAPDALKFYVDGDGDGYGGFQSKNLCEPDGVYVATETGDCLDSDKFVYPGQPEKCNGKDDNCDGNVDEGDSALCPVVANATSVCNQGCTVKCATGWANANGEFGDGCECAADSRFVGNIGKTCGGAENLGELKDNGSLIIRTGNILPGEQGDWFTFYASDGDDTTSGCDTFNVVAELAVNPNNQFAVDLYRGSSCSANAMLCSGSPIASWGTNFYGQQPYGPGALNNPTGILGVYEPSPQPEKGGECKCTTNPGLPGQNICKDNGSVFKVRVYRQPGAPESCDEYKLEISNGMKPIQ